LITTTKQYFKKSTLEDIDQALNDWFDKTLDIHVDNKGDKQKVEVLIGVGEKFAQIKNRSKRIRDNNNALILPIISIRRTGFNNVQDQFGLARFQKYLNYTKVLNQETSNRANLFGSRLTNGHITKAKIPVYEMIRVPFPKFVKVNYVIQIWAQYMVDMNYILEYIWTSRNEQSSENNWISIEGGGNKYLIVTEPESEDISNFEDMSDSERLIKGSMNMVVLGWILDDSDQGSQRSEPCVSSIEIKDEVVISDPKEIAKIFSK
jgi:hypothetical protein